MKEFVKDRDECAAGEGRNVSAGTLSEVMLALFVSERERQLAWINEASEKPSEEAISVPNPYESQRKFAEMGSTVEPPPGTLVPSSARDLPPPPPKKDAADLVATRIGCRGRRLRKKPETERKEATKPAKKEASRKKRRKAKRLLRQTPRANGLRSARSPSAARHLVEIALAAFVAVLLKEDRHSFRGTSPSG